MIATAPTPVRRTTAIAPLLAKSGRRGFATGVAGSPLATPASATSAPADRVCGPSDNRVRPRILVSRLAHSRLGSRLGLGCSSLCKRRGASRLPRAGEAEEPSQPAFRPRALTSAVRAIRTCDRGRGGCRGDNRIRPQILIPPLAQIRLGFALGLRAPDPRNSRGALPLPSDEQRR